MSRHKIGVISDFGENEPTQVTIGNVPISVFKIDGELYAIHDLCPHKDLPFHIIGEEQIVNEETKADDATYVAGNINEDELSINCPWHNLEFDLESGYNELLDTAIPTFEVEVEGDNVYIVD